jgi:hypothetical protein
MDRAVLELEVVGVIRRFKVKGTQNRGQDYGDKTIGYRV